MVLTAVVALAAVVWAVQPAALSRPIRNVTGPRRRIGPWPVVAVISAACFLVAPPLMMLPPMGFWVTDIMRRRRAARRRTHQILHHLGDVIALSQLGAEAGLTVVSIVDIVRHHAPVVFTEALDQVMAETERGRRLADVLFELPDTLGEAVRGWVSALVTSERYGVALVPALDVVAEEWRQRRRRTADALARRLPVTLLFPVAVCVLPATVLLTIVPLVITGLSGLSIG
jgi:tight adherence protein C